LPKDRIGFQLMRLIIGKIRPVVLDSLSLPVRLCSSKPHPLDHTHATSPAQPHPRDRTHSTTHPLDHTHVTPPTRPSRPSTHVTMPAITGVRTNACVDCSRRPFLATRTSFACGAAATIRCVGMAAFFVCVGIIHSLPTLYPHTWLGGAEPDLLASKHCSHTAMISFFVAYSSGTLSGLCATSWG